MEELKIKIDGSAVYKAVSNHLRNSQEFKQAITDKVNTVLSSESIEKSIQQKMCTEVSRYCNYEKEIQKIIKKEVREQVLLFFAKEDVVKDIVKKAFADMIIVK